MSDEPNEVTQESSMGDAVPVTAETRRCARCRRSYPEGQFWSDQRRRWRTTCTACSGERRDQEAARRKQLTPPGSATAIAAPSRDLCAGCRRRETAVDRYGRRRALVAYGAQSRALVGARLCMSCTLTLHAADDDPVRLASLTVFLLTLQTLDAPGGTLRLEVPRDAEPGG